MLDLIEDSPDAIVLLSEDCKVVSANLRARALWPDEKRQHLDMLLPEALLRDLRDRALERVLEGVAWSSTSSELLPGRVASVSLTRRAPENEPTLVLRVRPATQDPILDPLVRQLVSEASGFGQSFFEELVEHLTRSLPVRYALVAGLADSSPAPQGEAIPHLQTLAFAAEGRLQDPLHYPLPGSPCERTLYEGSCFYPDGVAELFPRDQILQDFGITSYVGVPIFSRQREWVGVLALLDEEEMAENHAPLLELFCSRAATEIGHLRSEREVAHHRQLSQESQARREAAEAELARVRHLEALGRLSVGVAHDFNNVLAGILLQVDLLEGALEQPGEEILAQLRDIRAAGEQATGLTRQLLAYGRQQPLERERVDIVQAVRSAAAVLRPQLPGSIALRLELPDEPVWLFADPGRLESVCVNLGLNARDAMGNGGTLQVCLRTITEARDRGSREVVEIVVEDEGHGVPEEIQDRIFEPFFSTKDARHGSGLGLASVLGTVQQHGGEVELRSRTSGASFVVTLPISKAPQRRQGEQTAADPSAQVHVMLVDDEPRILRVLERALSSRGFEVACFEDGLEAWVAFSNDPERWSLILSDAMMPRLSGVEFLQRVLSLRSLPCILTSGYIEDSASFPEGVLKLPKPFRLQELYEILQRCLPQE